jgi:hypothetical protein
MRCQYPIGDKKQRNEWENYNRCTCAILLEMWPNVASSLPFLVIWFHLSAGTSFLIFCFLRVLVLHRAIKRLSFFTRIGLRLFWGWIGCNFDIGFGFTGFVLIRILYNGISQGWWGRHLDLVPFPSGTLNDWTGESQVGSWVVSQ